MKSLGAGPAYDTTKLFDRSLGGGGTHALLTTNAAPTNASCNLIDSS
jgi:hypothetical protein